MKKIFVLTIISLICFSIESLAQRRIGVPSQVSDDEILLTWRETNEKVIKELDKLFMQIEEFKGLDRSTYTRWKEECDKIDEQYRFMLNYDASKKITYKTDNWTDLNKRIYNCINNVNSISEQTAISWNKNCNTFKKAFTRLKDDCNERYNDNPTDNGKKNQNKNQRGLQSRNQTQGLSYENVPTIPYLEKNNDNSNLTNAFRVCCTYPLAVKYYGSGIKVALDAAGNMVNNKYITDPELLEHWKYYKPLLTNYGKYNDEVIEYLQKQKDYIAKREWIIDNHDVIYIKRNLTTELSGYGSHYHQDYCIKYLDYVIDKYLDVLERASKGEFTLSAKFYDFFIKNELEPTQY